jgi:2'-5' RNA ligase
MVNRWESRAEPQAGQGRLYWHILFRDDPPVQALASVAQERLAPFAGLHFTPRQWLHITTLVVGLTEDFTATETSQMVAFARKLLADISPIVISFAKVLYHSEAIALGVQPDGALDQVRNAVWQATHKAIGEGRITDDQPWAPHVTVAYSTSVQSANPIIGALGRELPKCEAIVSSVNLVIQQGAERLWDWCRVAEVPLKRRGSE